MQNFNPCRIRMVYLMVNNLFLQTPSSNLIQCTAQVPQWLEVNFQELVCLLTTLWCRKRPI